MADRTEVEAPTPLRPVGWGPFRLPRERARQQDLARRVREAAEAVPGTLAATDEEVARTPESESMAASEMLPAAAGDPPSLGVTDADAVPARPEEVHRADRDEPDPGDEIDQLFPTGTEVADALVDRSSAADLSMAINSMKIIEMELRTRPVRDARTLQRALRVIEAEARWNESEAEIYQSRERLGEMRRLARRRRSGLAGYLIHVELQLESFRFVGPLPEAESQERKLWDFATAYQRRLLKHVGDLLRDEVANPVPPRRPGYGIEDVLADIRATADWLKRRLDRDLGTNTYVVAKESDGEPSPLAEHS